MQLARPIIHPLLSPTHTRVLLHQLRKSGLPLFSPSLSFLSPSLPGSFSLKLLSDDLAHAQICSFLFLSLLSSHLFSNVHRHVLLLAACGIPECHTSAFMVGSIYTQLLFTAATPESARFAKPHQCKLKQLSPCF